MRDDKAIGQRVRNIRHAKRMSAAELAKAINLHESQMRLLERGEKRISTERLGKLAEALDSTITYLKTGEGIAFPASAGSSIISDKISQPITPAERQRAINGYVATAALKMEAAEEARAVIDPALCHGGDMLANEPSDAWNEDAYEGYKQGVMEAVRALTSEAPIAAVERQLAERYPSGKQHIPRIAVQPRKSLWARFCAWLRG